MPRNSQGIYSLPAGNPVVDNTLIETSWANPTMEDIALALTGSLPRNGSAPMTAQLILSGGAAIPLAAVPLQQVETLAKSIGTFLQEFTGDLNVLTTQGEYRIGSTSTNTPLAATEYYCSVRARDPATGVVYEQECRNGLLAQGVWRRTYQSGTWNSWVYFSASGSSNNVTLTGTNVDFVIPTGVVGFEAILNQGSLSGTGSPVLQLGVGGVPVITNYFSSVGVVSGVNTTGFKQSTIGFELTGQNAANSYVAVFNGRKVGVNNNNWIITVSGQVTGALSGGGTIGLAGTLNLLRLTNNLTDTWDAGTAQVTWRF